MRTDHVSLKTMLVAGILGAAIGGCGSSVIESGVGGTPGSGGEVTGTGGTATGGIQGTGGLGSGGAPGSGGTTAQTGKGGATSVATGGVPETGGIGPGGRTPGGRTGTSTQGSGGAVGGATTTSTGGVGPGGATGGGGRSPGGSTGTAGITGGGGRAGGNTGSTGTCTASKDTGKSVSGSGPHKVVMESNSDAKASCGTIYRPADLGGADKYPIFVWGEGGCSRSGTSNQASMAEIASYGYFVIADGPAGSGGNCGSISMSTDVAGMAKVMIGYIDWAIEENGKSCSAYYGSLDPTKISADGFSCGGLMAMGTAGDPRMTTFGYTSSGLTSAVASYYKTIHTPVKILLGGSGDVAYTNGMRDYDQMVTAGVSVLMLSKNNAGHGGDLSNGKGDFNTVNLAWLNWQLKGDTGATGKGLLIGSSCKYCTASGWEFKSNKLE
jgi:hypothetical protein